MYTTPPNAAPTVTSVSGYDEDIIVGGYKNEDVTVDPMGQPNEAIPNLGNPNMNAFMAYIYSSFSGMSGEFFKSGEATGTQLLVNEENTSWTVYPNPAKDVIRFQVEGDVTFTDIRLKDMTGRTVKVWSGQEAMNGLSISEFTSGIYLLEVEQGGTYETRQIVIE